MFDICNEPGPSTLFQVQWPVISLIRAFVCKHAGDLREGRKIENKHS